MSDVLLMVASGSTTSRVYDYTRDNSPHHVQIQDVDNLIGMIKKSDNSMTDEDQVAALLVEFNMDAEGNVAGVKDDSRGQSAVLSSGASDRNGDPDMTSDEESGIYGESDANINKYPFRLDPCSQKVEQICVVEAFHHPLYSSTWLTYDVAVLLEKPASHQRAMFSVADGSDSKHGAMATALGGWGMVNKKTFSVSLQTVDVEIIRDDQCAKYGMTPMPCCVAELSVAKMVVLVTPEPPLIANDVIVGIMASGAGGTPDCGELPLLTLAATGWSCHGLPTARRSEGKRSGEDSRRMALALTEHWLAAYNTLDLTERGSVFPSAVETFK
ncbi:hypothetical protein JG687_00011282 [Phytophthora cactorum]|uniref:Uncharacterized protein n=1 Tax=Phytophthora cactorum TaxID=29920 RepID=A0A8T1U9K4_9STRA|nr:hypothetical protein JG687_00011282 [Phytophthora cactorum]